MVLPADVEVNIFWDSVTSCIIGSIFRGHFQHILDVLSLLTSTFTWKSSYRPLEKKSGIGFRTSNMADGWEVAKLDGNVLYKKGAFKDASSCSCSCSCSCPHRDGGTHVGS